LSSFWKSDVLTHEVVAKLEKEVRAVKIVKKNERVCGLIRFFVGVVLDSPGGLIGLSTSGHL
jgi:hypothetical protein